MITDPTGVVLLGDIHGSYLESRLAISLAHEYGTKVVVQLGDFGIWAGDYGKHFISNLHAELEKNDMMLYFVDGNHENFPLLYTYPIVTDGTRPITDRIVHLPRGFRWTWNDVTFLALGGAHSVDRQMRKEGVDWWPEEHITDADITTASAGGRVDIMITHDSPHSALNRVVDDPMSAFRWPESELATARWHRMQLDQVVKAVSPYFIFHGHYHTYLWSQFATEAGHRCDVVGLADGSAPQGVPAVAYVNLEELRFGMLAK